jgi:hypothetical protein
MANTTTTDEDALDRFSSEGGLPRQDPSLFECVSTPAVMSAFHPRRMPQLQLACPAKDGEARRYRMPLWRPRS